MRRGTLAAVGALVIGLAYAAISTCWALGGAWLLDTVGIALSKRGILVVIALLRSRPRPRTS
jgi:hypothetical protein